jgi:phosphomannomutase
MGLKFGTSGVRGLVTDMTDRECFLYTKAFVAYVKSKAKVESIPVAGDLRSSTPRIARAVAYAIRNEGAKADYCGLVATPAVMNYGVRNGKASIMVTGSHIPDDRNGIKFNMPWGEVLKGDEAEISRRYAALAKANAGADAFEADGSFKAAGAGADHPVNEAAKHDYVQRFVDFFPRDCLSGKKVVFYQHSSVSREVLPDLLETFGAEVVRVGFSESFVPVDTEAVSEPDKLAAWVEEYQADALVSTDGDADRPLVVDERGDVIRGDVLGILVSRFLGADAVATPISCNTALEKSGWFDNVTRTRIGSPYVVEAMNEAVAAGRRVVVGYEANGGFLTASDIADPQTGAVLPALPTRDAALPIFAVLLSSKRSGKLLSKLVEELPPRYTASGLLRGFPNEEGKALVAHFEQAGADFANEMFSESFGDVASMDFTDGARMTFASGDIVHLRPSGNAPEFRVYTESSAEETAERNNDTALGIVEALKDGMDEAE